MLLDQVLPFREAGFALHWLKPNSKAPLAEGWSTAPVLDADGLRRTFRPGNNVGVRLGEPSQVGGGYLHALDIDIRESEHAAEAWAAVRELLGDIDLDTLPMVASGSGGDSRHLYFVTDRPFYSRKLAVSEGKIRRFDKARKKGVWSYEWEIELFGTGKQVAIPPSVHPETGRRYTWERSFDFDLLDLGIAPTVPAERLEKITEAVTDTYDYEAVEPLTFKEGQLEKELADVPDDRIDDYHDWVTLGQALHHQFGGSRYGYDLWVEQSKRSEKFDEKDMRGKWRGFGRSRRRPVTMATVRQWVLDHRRQEFIDSFDDAFDDLDEPETDDTPSPDIDDLLGDTETTDPLDAPVDDPLDAPVKLPWFSLLDINADTGAIRPHLHNVALMVRNDPRIAGVPEFNLFTGEIVQRKSIAEKSASRKNSAKPVSQLRAHLWEVEDEVNGSLWDDTRDNDIRRVFEAPSTQGGYGIKVTDRDLGAGVDIVARENEFHPVREYLEALEWDGVARVERLFVDFLGAPDNPYTRDIARLTLLAAVTRVFEPGHKFDYACIIEGIQGRGKSTFIEILGRKWYAELDGDFHDAKQMVELMQGAWIMEIPELSGFNRADVRAIKAFISRKKDRARLAYARRVTEFRRQCIFIGSTNDREYLKDDTGGRRFWPVFCSVTAIDFKGLDAIADQLWAETLHLYREMRAAQPRGTLPLTLRNPISRQIATQMQETRRVEGADDALIGRIQAWLEQPVRTGGFDEDEGKPRTATCLIQIWCECLGGKEENYNMQQAQSLGRAMGRIEEWTTTGEREVFNRYGRQRVYRPAALVEAEGK